MPCGWLMPDARISRGHVDQGRVERPRRRGGIDLALLDLSLPDAADFSGFLRLRETYPRLPVAIVSSEEDQKVIREALALGAAGYLPKSTSKSELALSIDRSVERIDLGAEGFRGDERQRRGFHARR